MASPAICLQTSVSAWPVFKYSILHRPCCRRGWVVAMDASGC